MNKLFLYHGSKNRILTPKYGIGNPHNDYGIGFYCTENPDMALEWAVDADHDGYANSYELDASDLRVLDLTSDEYTILHWITILLQNRIFNTQTDFAKEAKQYLSEQFAVPYESYDVIRGYRADDSYFSFAQDFLNNAISLRTLSRAMYLGKLGEQVVLKSEKAFARLQYIGAQWADRKEWFPRKESRDQIARKSYFRSRQEPFRRGEIYIMQILDQELKSDDARLR